MFGPLIINKNPEKRPSNTKCLHCKDGRLMLIYGDWTCYLCGRNNNIRRADKNLAKESMQDKMSIRHMDNLLQTGYYNNLDRLFTTKTLKTRKTVEPRVKHYDEHGNLTAKECASCGKVKPATEYSPHYNNKDGHYSYCKPCASAKQTERYHAKRKL